jgi:hypothetical protein
MAGAPFCPRIRKEKIENRKERRKTEYAFSNLSFLFSHFSFLLTSGLRLDAVKPQSQAGNLARRGVAMEHALAGGFAQNLHRFAQSLRCLLSIAATQRFLRVFDRAMHMGFDRAVAKLALEAAAMALDGRWMYWNVWHIELVKLTMATRPVNGLGKAAADPNSGQGGHPVKPPLLAPLPKA